MEIYFLKQRTVYTWQTARNEMNMFLMTMAGSGWEAVGSTTAGPGTSVRSDQNGSFISTIVIVQPS